MKRPKLIVYFAGKAPIEIEDVDRIEIFHDGATYRLVPQAEGIGVGLDGPLGAWLSVLPFASNGINLHPALTPRRRRR